jgi:hypothetical protein
VTGYIVRRVVGAVAVCLVLGVLRFVLHVAGIWI